MEIPGLSNILAIVIGASMVMFGILTFYIFQKKLFNKYRDQVRNTMDKANDEPPVLENRKV